MRSFIAAGLLSGLALSEPIFRRQDKTPVNHEVFQKLSDYAAFPRISGLLSQGACPRPSNGAQLIQYIEIKQTDTQAAIWKLERTKEIVVGIPGTASIQDAITDVAAVLVPYMAPNVKCFRCQAHLGFLIAWNSLVPTLMKGLADALSKNPGYSTVISGHSLGGAVAMLACGSLKNGPFNVTQTFTYGQPRVGNKAFANYIDTLSGASDANPGNYYRVTHFNDGVPQLPPTWFPGYTHSRTEYWESAPKAEKASTYRCYGQEPSDCNNGAPGIGINEAHGSYAGLAATCN